MSIIDIRNLLNQLNEGKMKDLAIKIEEWLDEAYNRYNGDRERITYAFRKKFGTKNDYENFFQRLYNKKYGHGETLLNGSKVKEAYEPWQDQDEIAFQEESLAHEYARDSGLAWLEKNGNKFISDYIEAETEDEKEGLKEEFMSDLRYHMSLGALSAMNYDLTVSFDEADDLFKTWMQKNGIQTLTMESLESMWESTDWLDEDSNSLEEKNNAKELVGSGAWNKAEKKKYTKYDPPKTDNKGKSARKGFVG